MRTIRLLAAVMLVGVAAASAQDVAGVEDCTKTSGLDKRTGCLQANVNFLQRTMTRNALEADRRLQAAEGEIAALKIGRWRPCASRWTRFNRRKPPPKRRPTRRRLKKRSPKGRSRRGDLPS